MHPAGFRFFRAELSGLALGTPVCSLGVCHPYLHNKFCFKPWFQEVLSIPRVTRHHTQLTSTTTGIMLSLDVQLVSEPLLDCVCQVLGFSHQLRQCDSLQWIVILLGGFYCSISFNNRTESENWIPVSWLVPLTRK